MTEPKADQATPSAIAIAMPVASVALLLTIGVALYSFLQARDLAADQVLLRQQLTGATERNAELQTQIDDLSRRLSTAEARSKHIEAELADREQKLEELAQVTVQRELSKIEETMQEQRRGQRPGWRERGRRGAEQAWERFRDENPMAKLEQHRDKINQAREKIEVLQAMEEEGEMTEAEAHEAIADVVDNTLGEVLPPELIQRFKFVRDRLQEDMTEDERQEAQEARRELLNGIAELAEIHEQQRQGDIGPEEFAERFRDQMRENMGLLGKQIPERHREKLRDVFRQMRERNGDGRRGWRRDGDRERDEEDRDHPEEEQ